MQIKGKPEKLLSTFVCLMVEIEHDRPQPVLRLQVRHLPISTLYPYPYKKVTSTYE